MTETETDIRVHPVAELFPMMSEEELAELAENIKERGQLQAIVLGPEGEILDGRNRYAACKLAGVEPVFETYGGGDADGYALAVNITRRHLSTGARAVITAKAARLHGVTGKELGAITNLQFARISEASIVLDFAPELVPQILAGATPLSVALPQARERKKAAEQYKAKLRRLRDSAGDLADLVAEGRLDLDEALAALEKREDEAQQEAERKVREARAAADAAAREESERVAAIQRERRAATQVLCKLISALANIDGHAYASHYDPAEEPADSRITSETLIAAQQALDAIAETWQERGLE